MANAKSLTFDTKKAISLEEVVGTQLISNTSLGEEGIEVSLPFSPYSYDLKIDYNGTESESKGVFASKWYDSDLGKVGDSTLRLDNTKIYLNNYIEGVTIKSFDVAYRKPLWRDEHKPEFHEIYNGTFEVQEGISYLNFTRLNMFSNQFIITMEVGNDSVVYTSGDDYVLGHSGVLVDNHNAHTITIGGLEDDMPNNESKCEGNIFFSLTLGNSSVKAEIEYRLGRLKITKNGSDLLCVVKSVSQWFSDRHLYLEPQCVYYLSRDNESVAYNTQAKTLANFAVSVPSAMRLAHDTSVGIGHKYKNALSNEVLKMSAKETQLSLYNSLKKTESNDTMSLTFIATGNGKKKHNAELTIPFVTEGKGVAFNAHRSSHPINERFALGEVFGYDILRARVGDDWITGFNFAHDINNAIKARYHGLSEDETMPLSFAINSDIEHTAYKPQEAVANGESTMIISNEPIEAIVRQYNYVKYELPISFELGGTLEVLDGNGKAKKYETNAQYTLDGETDWIKRRAIVAEPNISFVLGADIETTKYHIWKEESIANMSFGGNIDYTTYKHSDNASHEVTTDMLLASLNFSEGHDYKGIITDWNTSFTMEAKDVDITLAYNNEQFKSFVTTNLANAESGAETDNVLFNAMVKSYTKNSDGTYDIEFTGYTVTPRVANGLYVKKTTTIATKKAYTSSISVNPNIYFLYKDDSTNYLTTSDGKYRLAVTRILRTSASSSSVANDSLNYLYLVRYDSESKEREIIPCGNIVFPTTYRTSVSANAWKSGQPQGYGDSATPTDYNINFKYGDYNVTISTSDFTGMTALSSSDWKSYFNFYPYSVNSSNKVVGFERNGLMYAKYVDSTSDYSRLYYIRIYGYRISTIPYEVLLSDESVENYSSKTYTITNIGEVKIGSTTYNNILSDSDNTLKMTNDGKYYLSSDGTKTYLIDKDSGEKTESGTYNSATDYYIFNYTDTKDYGFPVAEEYGFTLSGANIALQDGVELAENEVLTMYGKIRKKGENVYEFI